ncbi:hypothetical protein Taro_001527 [Colocasia esculenta]|uniref:Uncharacterized protein n=1 Tax=Colocasia esculenta TaxID=4460 RepID=A0A843TBA4_COLES|nr:hypothetical protein [Colocasia esculenta]
MISAHVAGCSCCCAACVVSVVARRVRVVAARLALDSLAVVFPYGGHLQASPGAVLLVVFGTFERVCITKAERACVWCGLHRCRVVVCGAGRSVPALLAAPLLLGSGEVLPESLSLLVLAEVRFPQNCSVIVSGCCCVGLEAEAHRLVALCSDEVSQNRCCCPGECLSQDCSSLISAVVLPPQSLRCAVGLAGAFWRVFPERCLGGSGGGSPRTGLRCSCSSAAAVSSLVFRVVWSFGLCILVKVLPRIALCRFWQRFFPGSTWALSVKASCAWPCVGLLRWPACLVVRFQVLGCAGWTTCPRGPDGCLLLAPGVLSPAVVRGVPWVSGWLCFLWKCQPCVVICPSRAEETRCVSSSPAFRWLLGWWCSAVVLCCQGAHRCDLLAESSSLESFLG